MRVKHLLTTILSAIGALCCAFVLYCEKLQFVPLFSKYSATRLAAVFITAFAVFFAALAAVLPAFRGLKPRVKACILTLTLILSVYALVWFDPPQSGLYREHTLTVRALPDENGVTAPVTLTWVNHVGGDVSLSTVQCEGNCDGMTLTDSASALRWSGKTGNIATVEFISGEGMGIAEVSWDDSVRKVGLSNPNLNRISLDQAFPSADGMPEFSAEWGISLLICFIALSGAVGLLPKWSVRRFFVTAFVCFASFRVCVFMTAEEPLYFIDSQSYLGMSEMSVGDILKGTPYCHDGIWYCISRPAFIPLVYKLCGQNGRVIAAVQLVISILAWGFSAAAASTLCRARSRKEILIAMFLGLGCVPNVTRWDPMIMSESLSISVAMSLVGSCFWLTAPNEQREWRIAPAVCAAVSALLYVQSRDSASWTVLLIAALLLLLTRLRQRRIIPIVLAAGMTVFCLGIMTNTGGRWQYPFENVLFNRIARDPQAEAFFIEAGMPTPPGIEELYGEEHMMGSALFNSDAMAPLREWIAADGLKTYIRWMLKEPLRTLRMTWYGGYETESFEQIGYTFAPKGFNALLPEALSKFFSMNLPGVLVTGIGLVCLCFSILKKQGERFAFPALLILSSYILCTGVFIADEYELARHSMVIILLMKASVAPALCMISEKDIE